MHKDYFKSTYLLAQFLIYRALDKLFLVDNLLHHLIVDLSAVLLKVRLAHLLLLVHKFLDVSKSLKLNIHLAGNTAEDVKHHGDDNVEDDPLNEDVEDHEVDARPGFSTRTAHHVSDRRPVVDDHEGV